MAASLDPGGTICIPIKKVAIRTKRTTNQFLIMADNSLPMAATKRIRTMANAQHSIADLAPEYMIAKKNTPEAITLNGLSFSKQSNATIAKHGTKK